MKSSCRLRFLIISLLYMAHNSQSKIMRNSALMNKMMTHFHKNNDNAGRSEPEVESSTSDPPESHHHQPPTKTLSLMQKVLCKNFPTIPCNVIMQDSTLIKLMERSIQQITYKKLNMDKTTQPPGFDLTLFPTINSEELSSFLQVSHTGEFNRPVEKEKESSRTTKRKKKNNKAKLKNFWSHENMPRSKIKNVKDSKRQEMYSNRKRIRKFYPHKIKYKDKNAKKSEFRDYSDEKLSMSVEVPDFPLHKMKSQMAYKVESEDPPVWRIDYMKHGEPSLNMFDYKDDRLMGKIMQTGPNVIVDENVLEQAARKEVLHPDVYIKTSFNHKNSVNVNSEGID